MSQFIKKQTRKPGAKPGAAKRIFRKKKCKFCADKVNKIDYKDINLLQRYVTERGKMTPSRITGNCALHQRILSEAVKQARFIALLPFIRL